MRRAQEVAVSGFGLFGLAGAVSAQAVCRRLGQVW